MKIGGSKIPARGHFKKDLDAGRIPFGRGVNQRISVLLVPELRKKRSQRDPELLRQQIEAAAPLAKKLKEELVEDRLDAVTEFEETYSGFSHGRLIARK